MRNSKPNKHPPYTGKYFVETKIIIQQRLIQQTTMNPIKYIHPQKETYWRQKKLDECKAKMVNTQNIFIHNSNETIEYTEKLPLENVMLKNIQQHNCIGEVISNIKQNVLSPTRYNKTSTIKMSTQTDSIKCCCILRCCFDCEETLDKSWGI